MSRVVHVRGIYTFTVFYIIILFLHKNGMKTELSFAIQRELFSYGWTAKWLSVCWSDKVKASILIESDDADSNKTKYEKTHNTQAMGSKL